MAITSSMAIADSALPTLYTISLLAYAETNVVVIKFTVHLFKDVSANLDTISSQENAKNVPATLSTTQFLLVADLSVVTTKYTALMSTNAFANQDFI